MDSYKRIVRLFSLALGLAVIFLSGSLILLPVGPAAARVLPAMNGPERSELFLTTPPTFSSTTLITPTNGVTLTYPWPAFAWPAAGDVEGGTLSYTLRITGSAGEIWGQTTTALVTTTATVYTASHPLVTGLYTWTVQATDPEGNQSGFLTPTTFVVDFAEILFPTGPLLSPADDSTIGRGRPTFAWREAAHPSGQALTYTLRLTSSGAVTSVWGQTSTATVILTTTSFLSPQPLGPDIYTWTVSAQDRDDLSSGFVGPARFTVIDTATDLYLPVVMKNYTAPSVCPIASVNVYERIPIEGAAEVRPGPLHGDLNLDLRGYAATSAFLGLINLSGSTDGNAPQLAGLFNPNRVPDFSSVYRVNNWDWGCGSIGCAGPPISNPEVTMAGLGVTQGEPIFIPERSPDIYGGGYKAMVLYAEEQRITLGYTRMDTVAPGYAVHIEGVCVDPNLLALYQAQVDGEGKHNSGHLPALRNNQILGTALGSEIQVVIRDKGSFMEPRSRKDWWQGF